MCSVRTEPCCSIWLNCLSGSMQTDNCLDPPAHKLESSRLFVLKLSLHFTWKCFLTANYPWEMESLSYYSVASSAWPFARRMA